MAELVLALSALPPRDGKRLYPKRIAMFDWHPFPSVVQEIKCGLRNAGVYHKFVLDKAFTKKEQKVKQF